MITAAFITTLLIFSAYPDPLQAENGGEAVQLHNPTSAPLTLDGFALATKTTSYPLPSVTVLPGAGYLIADTDWNTLRDNLSWPDADYELGLSLANTEGFVELRQLELNGSYTVIDSLAWNSTAGRAREGYAWTHEGEATPFFFNSSMQLVPIPIIIEETIAPPQISNITTPDDAPHEGVQLMGYARTITIQATITGATVITASLGGRETELERVDNTTTYRGVLNIPALAAGEYTLEITAQGEGGETTEQTTVTVLPTATIAVEALTLRGPANGQTSGTLSIQNIGNARRTIHTTALPNGVTCTPQSATLEPGMNTTLTCTGRPGLANSTGHLLVITE